MATDRPDWILDDRRMRVVAAVAVSVIAVATIVSRPTTPALNYSLMGPTVAVFWLWSLVGAFPRWPLYVLGLSVPITLNLVESNSEVSMFLLVVAIAILGSYENDRNVSAVVCGVVLVTMLVLSWSGALQEFAWPNWTFGILFSWGFGAIVHRLGQTIDDLQHARSLVADQAAVHERRRIARDVHDLVGHSLSVVMLHVTGARVVLRKDPDEAERALVEAEAAGRESLAEIRRTVGLLRDDADAPSAGLPSPDLTDVQDLVDEFLLAGLDISFDYTGAIDSVEGAAALAGYRIVQEALTNASRHTIGAHVAVSVEVGDTAYELTVRNQGGVSTERRSGSGFGLVSMRERAKSVGGSLIAGPTPNGWTVEASLPVAASGVLG